MAKELRCCFCGNVIEDGFGNNPEPAHFGTFAKCCDECNLKIVIPARLYIMELRRQATDQDMNPADVGGYSLRGDSLRDVYEKAGLTDQDQTAADKFEDDLNDALEGGEDTED